MGNQQSSHPPTPTTATSSPHSPNVTSAHGHSSTASNSHHHHHHLHYDRPFGHPNPRRRESIQALSTAKASAAPPSESLESASSLKPRSRARTTSSTTAAVAHHLRAAAQDSLKSPSFEDKMGNEQSRHKAHAFHTDKSQAHPHAPSQPSQPQAPAFTPPKPKPVEDKDAHAPSPQTRPVDVPAAPREDTNAVASRTEAASSLEPADASQEGYIVPSSHYSRPPRLPLPIEEEPHTPGSPIIAPTDLASPIDHHEIEGAFPRRSSMLSSTTADDDDLGDEFKGPQGKETVPTIVEWEGPGERVYVTGTFAGWDRKYRLHPK